MNAEEFKALLKEHVKLETVDDHDTQELVGLLGIKQKVPVIVRCVVLKFDDEVISKTPVSVETDMEAQLREEIEKRNA